MEAKDRSLESWDGAIGDETEARRYRKIQAAHFFRSPRRTAGDVVAIEDSEPADGTRTLGNRLIAETTRIQGVYTRPAFKLPLR